MFVPSCYPYRFTGKALDWSAQCRDFALRSDGFEPSPVPPFQRAAAGIPVAAILRGTGSLGGSQAAASTAGLQPVASLRLTSSTTVSARADDFGANATGRLGYAFGQTIVYEKGGWAYLDSARI